jgi:hypothetical protein
MTVHRYSCGCELDVPADAQFDEPVPGTTVVYLLGQAIQILETTEDVRKLVAKEKSK